MLILNTTTVTSKHTKGLKKIYIYIDINIKKKKKERKKNADFNEATQNMRKCCR